MKHISFDESTVMNELVKIASEKGLVKTAQPDDMMDFMTQPSKPATPNLDKLLKGGPQAVADVDPSTMMNEAYSYLNHVYKSEFGGDPSKIKEFAAKVTPDVQKLKQYFYSVAKQTGDPRQLKHYMAQLDKMLTPAPGANVITPGLEGPGGSPADDKDDEDDKEAPCGCEVGGCPPDADHDCPCPKDCPCKAGKKDKKDKDDSKKKKAAKDRPDSSKFYDVTGETGEQLVDKAHPGGGTKTELTHSKTDENLVETIVEQQEKDVEVARSVPKGTYAMLKSLYTQLSKMGHGERLNDLRKVMYSVAAPEDLVGDVLTSLADNLDQMGHYKAANAVDKITVDLKKKV